MEKAGGKKKNGKKITVKKLLLKKLLDKSLKTGLNNINKWNVPYFRRHK